MSDERGRAGGWGWPGLARKAHYFPESEMISLCGKWMYLGSLEADQGQGSKDDCVPCRRKLEKLAAAS